jgi:hypothetical protein
MQTRDSGWQPAGGDLTETAAQIACEQRGGTLERVGRLQSFQCIVSYADAGKTCSDGAQCQGDCRIEGNDGLNAGANVTGQCQASSNGFGCFTRVEDGKATATLCVD